MSRISLNCGAVRKSPNNKNMPTKNILLVLITLILLPGLIMFTGCDIVTASGETQTFEMNYANFSRVEISTGFNMEITRADSFFVSLTVDKSLYEYLTIAQRGDTLHIGLKANRTYTAALRTGIIRLPDLRRLELSGGSVAVVSGFSVTHNVDFALSGASSLTLNPTQTGDAGFVLSGASKVTGEIAMKNGSLDLSGASTLVLNGTAVDMKIDASGASSVTLDRLPLTVANVELSGASRAVIRVSDILDVKLDGGSDLEYSGSPKLGGIDISGGSKFNQVEP
jgi:hypothetical protein